MRGGVVADEDGGEAHVAELGDHDGHLLAHPRAERLAVDEGRRHRSEVTPVGARQVPPARMRSTSASSSVVRGVSLSSSRS